MHSTITLAEADGDEPLMINIIADVHLYPPHFTSDSKAYREYAGADPKLLRESSFILEAALQEVQAQNPDFLIIPGDLTKDGEREGHEMLARRLQELEAETGIEVFVINGNHDVYNVDRACSFANGYRESVPSVDPGMFRYIYRNFGYNGEHNAKYYKPPLGKQAGGLSYTVDLGMNYRLLALDTCMYSPDATGLPAEGCVVAGRIDDDLLVWAIEQVEQAERDGVTMIGMAHHGLIPHFSLAAELAPNYVIEDWYHDSSALADAGLRCVFTGHMHANDIAEMMTESGNMLVDVETGSLVSYGSPVRTATFERGALLKDGGQHKEVSLTLNSTSIKHFTMDGMEYEMRQYLMDELYNNQLPFYFIMGLLRPLLVQAGNSGVVPFITRLVPDFDLDAMLDHILKSVLSSEMLFDLGRVIGHVHVQYVDKEIVITPFGRAVWFIEPTTITQPEIYMMVQSIFDQLMCNYLLNDAWVSANIQCLLDELLSEPLHPGSTHNLYDFALELLLSHCLGGEQPADWVVQTLDHFSTGQCMEALADKVLIWGTLVLNELLDNIYLDFDLGLNGIMLAALNRKTSNGQLSAVLGLVEINADSILESFAQEYLTKDNLAYLGTTIQRYARSIAFDDTQDDIMDGEPRIVIFR